MESLHHSDGSDWKGDPNASLETARALAVPIFAMSSLSLPYCLILLCFPLVMPTSIPRIARLCFVVVVVVL